MQVARPELLKMVLVTLSSGDDRSVDCNFGRDSSLADVQQKLCGIFGQRFPIMKANLVVDNETFDDFYRRPFRSCTDGTVVHVYFRKTDDLYFFDVEHRRRIRPTLEEEVHWDDAMRAGAEPMELEEWVKKYRMDKHANGSTIGKEVPRHETVNTVVEYMELEQWSQTYRTDIAIDATMCDSITTQSEDEPHIANWTNTAA